MQDVTALTDREREMQAKRLALVIQVAATCRDNGLVMPTGIQFHPTVKQGQLTFERLDEVRAWAECLGVAGPQVTSATQYQHWTTTAMWHGIDLRLVCLTELDYIDEPVTAAVEAETSAILDSLLADTSEWTSCPVSAVAA